MSTPWLEVHDLFFHKIEEDGTFFDYFNLTEGESMELAVERANSILQEATARLNLEIDNGVDFLDYDAEKAEFNFDLTGTEKYLLACLQYEIYLSRTIAKLRVFEMNFVPNDLRVFSPKGDRESFLRLYETIKAENVLLIDRYKSKDRRTNAKREIDYASYNEE